MLKKILLLAVAFIYAHTISAQTKYAYTLDLQNVENDQAKVVLIPPKVTGNTAVFQMPSVIPGSYSRKDYGRFIDNFKAYDAQNKELTVSKRDKNAFVINNAKLLSRIEYRVNDTWDDTDVNDFVFQPGGSNIEADKNYSVNPHAFFGYLEGYKTLPIELRVLKPAAMFGATPLSGGKVNDTEDKFTSPNYVHFVDSPIMYCAPDTAGFQIANMRVLVSVYSPKKIITAQQIKGYLEPIGAALGNFFGKLPVDHYHFLMYFAGEDMAIPEVKGLSGFGALEHSYSSFYFLPEIEMEQAVKGLVQDVCAHEFLHILTPLNVHSEQIEDFNFVKPVMSRHLWMYEGVTEYFAHLSQLRSNVITPEQFRNVIREKINHASRFTPMSFTKMSQRIVDEPYQSQYLDVYEKGALIGLGLDLLLTQQSGGKSGLRELMLSLAKKYGPNKPFDDKKLIKEITKMTYKPIGKFFKEVVQGNKPVNYSELFKIVGWEFLPTEQVMGYSFGDFGIGINAQRMKLLFTQVGTNKFMLQENDLLLKINGQEVTFENAQDLFLDNIANKKDDKPVTMLIEREGKEMELTAAPEAAARTLKNVVRETENPSPEQLKFRQFLLTGK
jgi:predicted metalloprotease with PDZ domain